MISLIFSIFFTNLVIFLSGKTFKYFNNKSYDDIIESCIFGSIIISFIALFLNFFFPLTPLINTAVYFAIIIIFFFKKNKILNKKDFFFLIITVFFTFILISFSTINRPDAGLYHLPFTQILNENKLILGLSNIHFRFGHISIIQYLSAINFNILFDKSAVVLPLASFVSFLYIYFIFEVYKLIKNSEKLNVNSFFCLTILIYISLNMNEYGNFGNDTPAHLLFFFLISKFLKHDGSYGSFKKIFLSSIYIFLQKITLGLVLLFPVILILKGKYKFHKIILSFPSFFLLLWIFKNILISSCIIYPIKSTCFEILPWSDFNEIHEQAISGEAWSKGWPENKDPALTQKEFIKNFTWINSWSEKHLKYILKIILPYSLLLIITCIIIIWRGGKIKKITLLKRENYKLYSIIGICTLGVIIFFLKFPLYRYGYSYLIILLGITFSLLIKRYGPLNLIKVSKFIFFLFFIVIISKQALRMIKYYDNRSLMPQIAYFDAGSTTVYDYQEIYISDNFKIFYINKECMYKKAPCTNILKKNIFHREILNYHVIGNRK